MGGKRIINNKLLIVSIGVAVLVVLASFTSAVSTMYLCDKNKVTITTTLYRFISKEEIVTEITEEEAAEIMAYLEHLHVALIEGDEHSIAKYESLLNEKGILGENHAIFSKKDILGILPEKFRSIMPRTYTSMSKDIVNKLCFVNAVGDGNIMFLAEGILEYLMSFGAALILAGIIIPIFAFLLPLSLLLFYGSYFSFKIVHFLSHLVLFRLFHAKLRINLVDGNCSISDQDGFQNFIAPLEAILRGYCGITINLPISEKPYLFLAGFTLKSEIE